MQGRSRIVSIVLFLILTGCNFPSEQVTPPPLYTPKFDPSTTPIPIETLLTLEISTITPVNLPKTFSTPHGGGGPGAGPVGVNARLLPFLPVPIVERNKDGSYYLLTEQDKPQTIGRLFAHLGNAGVLLRAYIYARLLGREGMQRVAEFSTLNANYMLAELKKRGFDLAFPKRRATHEFIVTLKKLKDETGISAMDFAKRLLDKGYHAPTTYFPLLVPECFLIEPTETETREELDGFIQAMEAIAHEARSAPDVVKGAPHTLPVKRLDDVKAARELDLTWKPQA